MYFFLRKQYLKHIFKNRYLVKHVKRLCLEMGKMEGLKWIKSDDHLRWRWRQLCIKPRPATVTPGGQIMELQFQVTGKQNNKKTLPRGRWFRENMLCFESHKWSSSSSFRIEIQIKYPLSVFWNFLTYCLSKCRLIINLGVWQGKSFCFILLQNCLWCSWPFGLSYEFPNKFVNVYISPITYFD